MTFVLLGVIALLVVWIAMLTSRITRLESYLRGHGEPTSEALIPVLQRMSELEKQCGAALKRVGVVRYDAFGDTSGGISFSAALLTDEGDGLVVTALHGRSECRTYAKCVTAGASEISLSSEESEAISRALGRTGPLART